MPETTNAWHTLRAGESIRLVARLHGTTPLKLMELNPYLDPTALAAGQELNLPPAGHASLWPFLMGLFHRNRAARPPQADEKRRVAGGAGQALLCVLEQRTGM